MAPPGRTIEVVRQEHGDESAVTDALDRQLDEAGRELITFAAWRVGYDSVAIELRELVRREIE
jgi:hypothetical protein